ncbi:protein involved in protein folding in the ER [Schizosaccharomyces japonicus yFS275]|uniref:Protein involved in protein folding in the ER n=1 Tax=Schizosaccharomyces japonicus (strain yFS275 / FY16936) TaxID=402676 RepID=B6K034_SCHJY|nr:protein involved in protein folding in the ER [Schizosaccharomyces japonicus yFS275]EEB06184.1 protein involved in protein folding in the ER [Schizosaccharomyces japonicus yFS275]
MVSKSAKTLLLLAFGSLLHSAYSAYEAVWKTQGVSRNNLPFDIVAECLLSTAAIVVITVLSSDELKPISLHKASHLEPDSAFLSYRPNFLDIRKRREQYKATLEEK